MTLHEKFNQLENILLKERDSFNIQTGSPFILLFYDPDKEFECRRLINDLIIFLQHNNIKIIEIPLNTFIFNYLKKYNALEETFKKELEDKEEFIRGVSQIYSRRIKNFILDKIKEDTQVIFLTRIGSISPFFRVSSIIDLLLSEIKIPIVIFYPGTYILDNITNEEQVLFLGKYSNDSTYRTYPIV